MQNLSNFEFNFVDCLGERQMVNLLFFFFSQLAAATFW